MSEIQSQKPDGYYVQTSASKGFNGSSYIIEQTHHKDILSAEKEVNDIRLFYLRLKRERHVTKVEEPDDGRSVVAWFNTGDVYTVAISRKWKAVETPPEEASC